jgi:hypothetical protein
MASERVHLSRSKRDCASPSSPRSLGGEALRDLIPYFLRAYHGRGMLRVPDIGREVPPMAGRPYI